MGKLRVYELAREMELESNEVVDLLQELDIDVTSHMATIEEETAELVKEIYFEDQEAKQKKEEEEIGSEATAEEDLETSDSRESSASTSTKTQEKSQDTAKPSVSPPITVKELAEVADIPSNRLIKSLMDIGIMANINFSLEADTLEDVISELRLNVELEEEEEEETAPCSDLKVKTEFEDREEDYELRPPIVTVMGHVDHGKTTLLDVIRETRVTESEAGGITQHIGAYQIIVDDEKITFIDTPGHEAFTSMRARGAQITDIAILVVAADDGIMPQTVEAINHAQAAEIPILVAINKIDKHNARPDQVKQQMTEYGLVPEEWGGQTICVEISALQGENIDELLEMILLQAEIEEIMANPQRPAEGVVIEAELDKGRGPVATVLIKNGTLKVGDTVLAGAACGRVRAMIDEHGNRVKKAGPSTPVEILGFSDVPEAGDFLQVLADEKRARDVAEERKEEQQEIRRRAESGVTLEDFYEQVQDGEIHELNLIIKADVQGSIEALRQSLERMSTEEVNVNVIHTGVGAITETDVDLASASNAIIIGFNVRPGLNAQKYAEKEKVDIRTYRVIYKALEDIRDAMEGLLEPELKERVRGHAEVRQVFKVPDVGNVAGVYVRDGIVNRNFNVRVIRDGVVQHEGELSSLKRFEEDVREVQDGYECGVGIANYNDIKEGDILEFYDYKEVKRTL